MTTPKNSSVYATFPSTYYIHRRQNPQTIFQTKRQPRVEISVVRCLTSLDESVVFAKGNCI